MRLIDADDKNAACEAHFNGYDTYDLEEILECFPTIDAVQVVRCKECRHWWKKNELCVHKKCITGKAAVVEAKAEHFCAYGERKED